MNVLIIGTLYEPDLGPSAPLFTMLSTGLVRRGHHVTVVTTVPHYPSGRVSAEYRGKLIRRSVENGVEVIRLLVPSLNRKRLGQRLIQFISYQLGATLVCSRKKYDVLLSANPSLVVWLPFFWEVIFKNKPAVYSVHDVYPDVGITLGVFRAGPIIKLVSSMERFCLQHAKLVRILSESFRPHLQALGIQDSKMTLIYDWVDTELIHPINKTNPFSQQYELNDKFVVQYAGNIGLSQGLENILDVAKRLVDQRDIQFVFIGDGAGRESLNILAREQKLPNVQFIPFQPREKLPEVLASADISLVILRHGIGLSSLPSKTFSIMASGRPLVVSVDKESETYKLVTRANAGICVPPEDPSSLAEAILQLKQNKSLCEQLGQNGRLWVEQYHSPERAAQQFENILMEAIALHEITR